MPSAFDCHDRASGFDCKIRLDSHDVYAPGTDPSWVIEYAYSGSTNSGLHFICLACTGSRVLGITYTGEIYDRSGSGSWVKIASGFAYAGADVNSGLSNRHNHWPLITCQGDGRNFVNQQTGVGSVIVRVVTGSTTAWASMNNLSYCAGPLVDNAYGTHCLDTHISGTTYSGYLWDGSASNRGTLVSSVVPPLLISDDLYSGHVMSPTAYFSGTTGLTRNVIDSGSGYPSRAYQICTYSGVAYAVHSGGYSIRAISGVDSGWQTVGYLRQTGTGIHNLGASKAANGKMYLSYVTGKTLTGAPSGSGLVIDEVDLATMAISASNVLPAHPAVAIPDTSLYKINGWFCKNSSSIYYCGQGYILRKDL